MRSFPGMTSLLLASALLALVGCERPPVESVQRGYRGTGMVQVFNPRTTAVVNEQNVVPESLAPASADGPKASTVYQNLKVLGDLSVAEFTRNMQSITQWVAPEEGCGYCHNLQNLADDSKYTKVVARRMLQMTQNVNANWKTHVGDTGVTCYTCHRGKHVPDNVWFMPPEHPHTAGFTASMAGQNAPAKSVGLSSLPLDPFTPYLVGKEDIRVTGLGATSTAHTGSTSTIKGTEATYGLMMHMSQSLGVNCTFCHNSRAFSSWETSTPQRETAWHGIRMARDLNNDYLTPLTSIFPAERLGPVGDVAKVNCGTCHQGVYKPLWGAQMAKNHPELQSVKLVAATGTAPMMRADGATVYFAVGSAALAEVSAQAVSALAANLKASGGSKATISGYHSAAGDLAQNQELAKQRAFAVRDALKAAGVGDAQVVLQKPQSAEANLSGEDPSARRVDVLIGK